MGSLKQLATQSQNRFKAIIPPYINRIKGYIADNHLLIIVSGFFLLTQFLYSWLIWHRSGNLPPTPGDSYNYLVNIHRIAVGETIFTSPSQYIYGGFNFLYSYTAHLFRLSPQDTYHVFFYLGKIFLLCVVIYLVKSFTTNKKLIALLIIALSVYSGTGEAHGFFWVVPSFWSVMIFLLLVGMAMRQKKFFPLILVSIFFMFVHPLSVYTTAPIIIVYLVLKKIKSKDASKFGRLALALILAAIIQQTYLAVMTKNYFGASSASELNQVSSVLEKGVVQGVDPHGNTGIDKRSDDASSIKVGLLTIGDIFSKLRSTKPESNYAFEISIPKSIYRVVPGLYGVWNAYGFLLAPAPLIIAGIILLFYIYRWGLKNKDTITVIYFSVLLVALGATIHPQGFRFLAFLWPFTYLALVNYAWISTEGKKRNRIIAMSLVTLFVLGQLSYGIFLTSRISKYQDYKWDKSCAVYLVEKKKLDPNLVLFYSGLVLAPTPFVGEGLYSVQAVDTSIWNSFLKEPVNKNVNIIYLNDKFEGYGPSGTVKWLKDKATENSLTRGKQIQWTSCGDFEYGEEK